MPLMRLHTGNRRWVTIERIIRIPFFDWIKYFLVIGTIGWLVVRGGEQLGYNWQWYRIPQYVIATTEGRLTVGPLIQGLWVTLKITGISLVLAFAFGLVTALCRLSRSFIASLLARGYLELVRNTPLIVQLFFIYFVIAPILNISGFTAAVLALSLFEGAYAAEIFRAGIMAVHRGQWEAASSLGLDRYRTYRLIVLPQAIRYILPPLASQAVSLIKDSALVSTIAIYDLTMQGQIIMAQTYLVFELWFTVAAMYLIITSLISLGIFVMESHLRTPD
jgi:polar amino acid transport system permease protein